MDEKFTFFWSGPFSQWHPCKFIVNSIEYNCAEQYMMYQKALYFQDIVSAEKILKSSSPKSQKALGRKITPFDIDKWNNVAQNIVLVGNLHKFQQNKDLYDKLIATEGTTLVEASPYDKIWGIGLRETDLRAQKRETWNGTNWLGEILTIVRAILLEQITSNVKWDVLLHPQGE